MTYEEIEVRIADLACEKFELVSKTEAVDRELELLIERNSAPEFAERNLRSIESGSSVRKTSL